MAGSARPIAGAGSSAARRSRGIIGQGYVGLPLAVEVARSGFRVLGFDISEPVVQGDQRSGRATSRMCPQRSSPATSRRVSSRPPPTFERLAECDAISICVPTPLNKTKDPDLSYVVSAARVRASRLCARDSSSSWRARPIPARPGRCVLPILEQSGLKVGRGLRAVLQPRAGRSGQPDVADSQHSQGDRRHHAARAASWAGAVSARSSTPWCRSRVRRPRSW